MKKDEAKARIREIGIFPGIRVNATKHALYAAEMLRAAGIPVAEITMTVPEGVTVIRELAQRFPDFVVGAGTVLDAETAKRCLDAGARFITSTGFVVDVIEATLRANVVAIPARADSIGGDCLLESGCRLRENLSRGVRRRRSVCSIVKATLAAHRVDRRRRGESTKCDRLYCRWFHSSWCWIGAVTKGRNSQATGSPNS